jgi:hypothetical protein
MPVTLIGHPFVTIGMGEQFRSHIAACLAVHMPFGVLDVYRHAHRSDPDHRALVEPLEIDRSRDGIRIFHINGDEVDAVVRAFEARGGVFSNGYNIIVPAWELPVYPTVWAEQLRKFNEVWALSRFVADSLSEAGIYSTLIGQPVEVPLGQFLPRKYFAIRESAFVILHFFDLSSYSTRKNPDAVLRMFKEIRRKREFDDIQLVLKVKEGDKDAGEWLQPVRDQIPEAHLISRPLSALETKSLINASDCFVSLHRSEGFGRGTGEAMFLGRLAMATAWSGNLDYMTNDNSLLVDCDLVPVQTGEYPFGEGQRWANPNADHAAALLDGLIDNPERVRALAARGRRDIRLGHSYRAVGLRVLDRVTEIAAMMRSTAAPIEPVVPASLPLVDVEPLVAVPLADAERDVCARAVTPKPEARRRFRKDFSARAKRRQATAPQARTTETPGLVETMAEEASDAGG